LKFGKTMIELKSLSKSYNNIPVFSDVDFRLEMNHIIFIIGANGSGKTTFVKLLAQLIKPDLGSIQIDKYQINNSNEWKKYCKFVLDDSELIDDLNALDHMSLIGYLSSIPKILINSRAKILCDIFKIPTNKKIRNISKGQKCKLNIIMNLLTRPKYFILDEPFVYLDIESKIILINLLNTLSNIGCGILVTTNDLSIINSKIHTTYLIKNGKIDLYKSEFTNNQNLYEEFISLTDDSNIELDFRKTFFWLFE